MRPLQAQSGSRNGAPLLQGRCAAGPIAARRDAHDNQLHRPSITYSARRILRGVASPQRLGPRPGTSTTKVLATTACSAWRNPNWETVRRRHADPRRTRAGAHTGCVRRKAAGLLSRRQNVFDTGGSAGSGIESAEDTILKKFVSIAALTRFVVALNRSDESVLTSSRRK